MVQNYLNQCVAQWHNICMNQITGSSLVQVMVYHLSSVEPFAEPMLTHPSTTSLSNLNQIKNKDKENAFQNIVCRMLAILFRLQLVNCNAVVFNVVELCYFISLITFVVYVSAEETWGFLNIYCLTSVGIPIIKIRWSYDHLIFIMEIPIPGKTVCILKPTPCLLLLFL